MRSKAQQLHNIERDIMFNAHSLHQAIRDARRARTRQEYDVAVMHLCLSKAILNNINKLSQNAKLIYESASTNAENLQTNPLGNLIYENKRTFAVATSALVGFTALFVLIGSAI